MWEMKEIGVYIHIPFCKRKCLYCDFVSFANKQELQKDYIQALKKEIQNWKNDAYKIKTIYIGGGTPSYIDSNYISEIINLVGNAPSITIELNPGTVTKEKLLVYKNAGINRLSIGLQSTNDNLLKQIGRIHNYNQFLETYNLARELGFNNINVDLMTGLPNQSIKDIKQSLEDICRLNPEHISVYSLIVEESTPIQKLIDNGELELPDEETERQMYWYVKDYLELNGYKHYEISNFAKPGFESEHNLDCWNQKEYIGFGAGAYSYLNKKRFGNISNLEKYIQNCNSNNFEKNVILEEAQDKNQQMNEYMILGLRKIDGISIQKFEEKFNENPILLFRKELQKLYEDKLLTIDGDIIKLSNKGLDLANIVSEEFV